MSDIPADLPPLSPDDRFFGVWRFDPAQAEYNYGMPPQSGVYTLEPEGQQIKVTMEWIAADSQRHKVTYYSIPDGKEYPYGTMGDTVTTTRLAEHVLTSTTKRNGQMVAHATRMLSDDGRSMHITMGGYDDKGEWYENVSVYVK
jgi:hypothetical protein